MRYYVFMIKSFRDKTTAAIFCGHFVKSLDRDIQYKAYKKLQQIDSAARIDDLRLPSSNRLEKKEGSLKNYYCIWVNKQWRICFKWSDDDAYDLFICDYH